MGLFRKKDKPLRVVHYEGLRDFMQDFPCTVEVKDDLFVIKRIKPESTVTLPINRILAFDSMEEENFMLKYHGEAISTSKDKKIGGGKYYLVVRYEAEDGKEKYLAFWGTISESSGFRELQKLKMETPASSYSL